MYLNEQAQRTKTPETTILLLKKITNKNYKVINKLKKLMNS